MARDVSAGQGSVAQEDVVFQAAATAGRAGSRGVSKKAPPVVNNISRMMTRSRSALNGFKPEPVKGVPVQRKKAKKAHAGNASTSGARISVRPPTPLGVLQQLGHILEIDPSLISADKLNASAADKATDDVSNE